MSGPAPREARRRWLHLGSGALATAAWLPEHVVSWAFATLLAVALILETVRLTSPPGRAPLGRGIERLFRPAEARGPSGASLLAAGYAATFVLFPAPEAARAVLVSAAADPAAAVVGSRFARATGVKTWWGTSTAFAVATLVLWLTGAGAAAALAAGAAAAAAERVPWRGADNLAVPLATAAVLRLLR